MPKHDDLLDWIDVAAKSDLGYDQGQRLTFLDLLNHRIKAHTETDCSALTSGVIALAGYPLDLTPPLYTGSLRQKLTGIGWTAIPVRGKSLAQLQALMPYGGEVLLNETHHVVIQTRTVGSFLSANIDERGRASGGKAGNQTGQEVSVRPLWMYSHGWDYVLIPPDAAPTTDLTTDQVKALQAGLKAHFPLYAKALTVDGIFGPATLAAVKEFQRRSGLTVDGIVGDQTKAALAKCEVTL